MCHSNHYVTYVFQHVKDAAVSGSVHSLVSRDEHSQGPGAPQRRRSTAVLNTYLNQSHYRTELLLNLHHHTDEWSWSDFISDFKGAYIQNTLATLV